MKVKLSNPQGLLPWPGVSGRIVTAAETIDIDPFHPFWSQCLADGTLIEVSDKPAAPKPESKPAAKE